MPHSYTKIFDQEDSQAAFSEFLLNRIESHSQVITLSDSNCMKLCMPNFLKMFPQLTECRRLEISPMEQYKNLRTCEEIWEELTNLHADRKTLLINLGGGFVSDIGGFCASVYKRGIAYINVPTTLLSQVDASIGGKTGVNFLGHKNLLGSFHMPEAIFIHPSFLSTLSDRDLTSGVAEMLKHALIADRRYWQQLSMVDVVNPESISVHVPTSIRIKQDFIKKDIKDFKDRKKLNFGHTVGHAVESLRMEEEAHLLHGEAIAIGLICESFLSFKHNGLDHEELDEICSVVLHFFPSVHLSTGDFHRLIQLMQNDKKNEGKKINFTLLSSIGESKINCEIEADDIVDALQFYNEQSSLRRSIQ